MVFLIIPLLSILTIGTIFLSKQIKQIYKRIQKFTHFSIMIINQSTLPSKYSTLNNAYHLHFTNVEGNNVRTYYTNLFDVTTLSGKRYVNHIDLLISAFDSANHHPFSMVWALVYFPNGVDSTTFPLNINNSIDFSVPIFTPDNYILSHGIISSEDPVSHISAKIKRSIRYGDTIQLLVAFCRQPNDLDVHIAAFARLSIKF